MIEIGNGIVVNCLGCGKEYNMDGYKKLKKAKPSSLFIGSVYGKKAPKEAIEEVARRTYELGLDAVIHKEHVDIYREEIHDPRICSECGTEFGYVKIVGKDKDNTIYQIDLDLIEPKEAK